MAGIDIIHSQIQPDFNIPDKVCADELFQPVNQTIGIDSFLWHFCSANMSYSPSTIDLGNTGFLNNPTFIALAEDSGNFYSFVSNLSALGARSIIRNRHGKSLTGPIVAENLGNVNNILPKGIEGIQIVQDDSKDWYGFVVGGTGLGSRLVRLSFGKSLRNFPTASNLGNFNMDFPSDFTLTEDQGAWVGFTVNQNANSITRFDFTMGLNATPAGKVLLKDKIIRPWGLSKPVKENGNWYMFVTSMNSDTIRLLNFGNSLLNLNPLIAIIPDSNNLFEGPIAFRIIQDCEKTYGLVSDRLSNKVLRLEFPDGVSQPYKSLGSLGGFISPIGITEIKRENNEVFAFVSNFVNHTISYLQYLPCTEPSVITSNQLTPPELYYHNPGIYNVNLVGWKDSITKDCKCKNIEVLKIPDIKLPEDSTVCPYDRPILNPNKDFTSYKWNTNETSKSIVADTAGIYILEVKNELCSARDTIEIFHFIDDLNIGNDASFTPGNSITLRVNNLYNKVIWNTGSIKDSITVGKPGTYAVAVQTQNCTFNDTILLTLNIDIPNFFTPNNDSYNDTWKPDVFYHYPESEIFVYDRFGKTVAHFRGDKLEGWDGTYNNKRLINDTYWYVIDLKDGSKPIRGSVTLIAK